MFRLQDNVPQIYINESRDFQLFCRLYDCINNGVMFDISTMIDLYDPFKVNERMLNLLCTKIGFFPKQNLSTDSLRYIISSFPYMIKHKGSKKGIEIAVSTILKINNSNSDFSVLINNYEDISGMRTYKYNVQINFKEDVFDISMLDELLKYVLPVGYTYNIYVKTSAVSQTSRTINNTLIKSYIKPSAIFSQVTPEDSINIESDHPEWFENSTYATSYQDPAVDIIQSYTADIQPDMYIANIDATTVIGSDNYSTDGVQTSKIYNEHNIEYNNPPIQEEE